MKKYLLLIFIQFSALIFAQSNIVQTLPSNTNFADEVEEDIEETDYDYEKIYTFHSDIIVNKNADVTVTETIKVNAKGNSIKRGIFRSFPTVRNINGGVENVSYKVMSIKRDGAPEPYHTKKENRIFTIYIGDKDSFLSYGEHTYEITYRTQNQIGYFDKFDELYWNVNGTDWQLPIDSISAKITLPEGADIIQNACYTGEQGSTAQDCSSQVLSNNTIEFGAKNIYAKENLTIAVGFKKGVLTPPSGLIKFIRKNWMSFPLLFGAIYLLFFYYKNWLKYGKDPEKPIIFPQFNAPDNLSPASIGYIDKERFDNSLTTATLIDLSIKGYVVLDEIKKPSALKKMFKISRTDKNDKSLSDEEQILLRKIFKGRKSTVLDGEYDEKIANAVAKFEDELIEDNKELVFDNDNGGLIWKAAKIIIITFLSLLFVNALISNEYTFFISGLALVFFDGILLWILLSSWNDSPKGISFVILFFFIAFFSPIFFIAFFPTEDASLFISNCFKFLFFGFVSIGIFKYLIKKPTYEKVRMKSLIEGFKMYLGTAEEHLLKAYNPPEMTKTIFEEFLPYAIVFGVEDIWGRRFKLALEESLEPKMSPYYNSMQDDFGYTFSSSISNILESTTDAPYVASSHSSSSSSSSSYSGGSSSSGSGGGGSSGGGGGGGGGGGW